MKHIYYIIGVATMVFAMTSCGNQNSGKKFNPVERTATLSHEEREAALEAKRAELSEGLNLDTLLYSHGVKFSVMRPKTQGEDITDDIAERISMKLLQIACKNGISGVGENPGFVFGTEIAQTGRAATATAPQKMTVKYNLTFKVMNTVTGDVYGTATQEVMGVGSSFAEANQNFVSEIKNTAAIQKMLQTASQRIIEWYNQNTQKVKSQIDEAAGRGDYELALAIASSVPEQAKAAYQYASSRIDGLTKGLMHKKAADMLGEMSAAVAAEGEDFNPAVGAYLKLIPTDTPEHTKAQELYNKYVQQCKARRDALEARAEREAKEANDRAEREQKAARELEKFKMMQEHEKELAEIEADKVKMKYKAKAAAAKANGSGSNRGLFGSLGYAIGGSFERIFKVADVAGAALTDKMDLKKYKEEVEDDF